ncbi:MAG: ABC transporter permease [Candidatus Sungbacteria bacterium]|nr:ABC transporter permease [Candidatus Sungbacteria bacterium]
MSVSRIYAVFLRQMLLIRSNWARFSNIFIWVAVDVVLWGFITRYLDTVSRSGFSFVPLLLGAILLWDFLVRVKHGVILAILEDIWSRNFLNYFASPLRVSEYIAGLVLTSAVTSMTGFLGILLIAFVAFGFTIFKLGAALALFLFILFTFGLSFGIAAAAVIFRFGPAAEWIVWPMAALVSPFAGVFYPVATLPLFLQPVAKIIPASYVFEGMREVIFSGTIPYSQFFIGALLALIYLFLSYFIFLRVHQAVIRSGAIIRFSAEDMS